MANEAVREKNIKILLQTAYECFLEQGIEKTTQVDLSRRSGISLRSINRYFTDHTDLVLHVADYVEQQTERDLNVLGTLRSSGKTGIELLIDYMERLKEKYLNNPDMFFLRSEFSIFARRHHIEQSYIFNRVFYAFRSRPVLEEIFRIGEKDTTIKIKVTPEQDAAYLCSFFLGLIGYMAINVATTDDSVFMRQRLERAIQETVDYCNPHVFLHDVASGTPCDNATKTKSSRGTEGV